MRHIVRSKFLPHNSATTARTQGDAGATKRKGQRLSRCPGFCAGADTLVGEVSPEFELKRPVSNQRANGGTPSPRGTQSKASHRAGFFVSAFRYGKDLCR